MIDPTISCVRDAIWRVWAAPGPATRPRGRLTRPSASLAQAVFDAGSIGDVLIARPRAASSRPETDDLAASIIGRTIRSGDEDQCVTCRLASVALVVGAALADAAGEHGLAYYALVAAVPAAAVAALSACGDVLDGTAAGPVERRLAILSAVAAPLVLLGAAARAPLVEGAPPPALAIGSVVACLALFAVQALLAASVPRVRPVRVRLRPKS